MDAEFNNEEVGASAYDPRVMFKVVLLRHKAANTHRSKDNETSDLTTCFANSGVRRKQGFLQPR